MKQISIGILFLSALAIFISPVFMPESYSWISNAISESGAQQLKNAWITRLGFVLFGVGVIYLSISQSKWHTYTRVFHSIFGLCMLFTAAFSHKPFDVGIPYDLFEDQLHSLMATVMGFAYSFGVMARYKNRGDEWVGKVIDMCAVAIAIVIPLLMLKYPDIDGLIQRIMFGASYFWYLREGIRG